MISSPDDTGIRTPIPPKASGYADVNGLHMYYETVRAGQPRSCCCTAG